MEALDWKLRARVFYQRLSQPACACMISMSAPTFLSLLSLPHWKIALQTGVGTGMLALLISFTPLGRLFAHRYANATLMGVFTAIADAWSHAGRFQVAWVEPVLTGVVSGLIVLAASYLFEDRGRRVRAAWARVRGKKFEDQAGNTPRDPAA